MVQLSKIFPTKIGTVLNLSYFSILNLFIYFNFYIPKAVSSLSKIEVMLCIVELICKYSLCILGICGSGKSGNGY